MKKKVSEVEFRLKTGHLLNSYLLGRITYAEYRKRRIELNDLTIV